MYMQSLSCWDALYCEIFVYLSNIYSKNKQYSQQYYCSSAPKLLLFISWSKDVIQNARWLTLTVTAYLMSSQFTQQETWLFSANLRQSLSLLCILLLRAIKKASLLNFPIEKKDNLLYRILQAFENFVTWIFSLHYIRHCKNYTLAFFSSRWISKQGQCIMHIALLI